MDESWFLDGFAMDKMVDFKLKNELNSRFCQVCIRNKTHQSRKMVYLNFLLIKPAPTFHLAGVLMGTVLF